MILSAGTGTLPSVKVLWAGRFIHWFCNGKGLEGVHLTVLKDPAL